MVKKYQMCIVVGESVITLKNDQSFHKTLESASFSISKIVTQLSSITPPNYHWWTDFFIIFTNIGEAVLKYVFREV